MCCSLVVRAARGSRLAETQRVMPADVIIFEGILVRAAARASVVPLPPCADAAPPLRAPAQTLAMDDVRGLLNMKIFVDTDDDVRLARRIKRDTCDRGRDVHGVIEQYTKFVKPMFDAYVSPSKKHADVIIPWAGGENGVAIDLIVQHITSKLGQSDLRRIFNNLKLLPSNYQIRGMHTIIRDRATGARGRCLPRRVRVRGSGAASLTQAAGRVRVRVRVRARRAQRLCVLRGSAHPVCDRAMRRGRAVRRAPGGVR